ncbi:hypothetical protein N9W12_01180 [Luminiphilus sp.]|nr:hypothetical protein [Luminiphilus sp.]
MKRTKQRDKLMKKILLILLTIGTVALTLVDMGVPFLFYLSLPALLTALAGFYIWAASGEGDLSSAINLRRGADGAVLMSWISVLMGFVVILASFDPSDVEGAYASLSVCILPLFYGYLVKFLTAIFTD